MELDTYLANWQLSSPVKITETATSHLYRVASPHGPAVLKLLNEAGQKYEVAGALFLKACGGAGAAQIYEFNDKAQLIEYLPGENLYQFSKESNEHLASEVFVKIIKQIQSTDLRKCHKELRNFSELFDAFNRQDVLKSTPSYLKEFMLHAQRLIKILLKSQTQEVLLHGDLHHENILQRKSGEFVCFDAQPWVGDPAYELGTTLKNPWDYPEISHDLEMFLKRAKYFAQELSLLEDRIISFAFVHACLSICWAIEDGDDFEHSFGVAKMIWPIIRL